MKDAAIRGWRQEIWKWSSIEIFRHEDTILNNVSFTVFLTVLFVTASK